MKVGLQGTTATDIGGPAVEAAAQGVGVANVHLYGLDACVDKTHEHSVYLLIYFILYLHFVKIKI